MLSPNASVSFNNFFLSAIGGYQFVKMVGRRQVLGGTQKHFKAKKLGDERTG
jgi:hypothetical protein